MSNNNWESIKQAYEAGGRSLRDIGAEFGVSEGAIRKKAKAGYWVKPEGTQNTKSTQVRKESTHKKSEVRTNAKVRTDGKSKKEDPAPAEIPKRKGGNPAPVRMFTVGNTAAVKHSAYARRMMLPDDVIEEAQKLTLADDLFRLRAANLMASETIGRLRVELEEDGISKEERQAIESNLRAAETGLARNTSRIESIEHTMASIAKMGIDANYRVHATEKVIAEVENLKSGGDVVATIVHNSLPIPR